jgi:cytidyltransferase-like protein
MSQINKKVMVFGVFDGLHGGHVEFLKQARNLGDLIVVVAQDATVEVIKQKRPKQSLGYRIAAIKDAGLADVLVAGDLVQYSWSAIRRYEPDVIALGYDQKGLKDALKVFQGETHIPFDIVVMDPYEPDKLHSSILHADVVEPDSFDVLKKRRIAEKKKRFDKGEYLADFVYGANDGIITTFAVVTGAAGASLPAGVIVILGVANLIADGFSMGASSILSMLSERNFHKSLRREQEYDIEHNPEIAKEEVRDVLKRWDTPRESLESMMLAITRSKRRWSDFVLREEYNITEEDTENPTKHGVATFIAFVIVGTLPLVPYLFGVQAEYQLTVSIIATAIALFFTGAAQSLLTVKTWWLRTGVQMLALGGVAAALSYGIGYLIKTVFQIVV